MSEQQQKEHELADTITHIASSIDVDLTEKEHLRELLIQKDEQIKLLQDEITRLIFEVDSLRPSDKLN